MGKKRTFDDDDIGQSTEQVGESVEETNAPRKQVKAAKPLPPGYVCNACGMKDDHAIYNCPLKVSKKEGDKKSGSTSNSATTTTSSAPAVTAAATMANENNSSTSFKKYVFVSGLPFDMTKARLLELIDENDPANPIDLELRDIFIVTFKDNPHKCRGLAYITCHSKAQFDKVLTVHGKKLGRLNISAVESATSDGSARKPIENSELLAKGQKVKRQGGPRCYRCGGDHDPNTCENPRICYKCRGTDHLSKDCPKKKKM